ncbi:hypothetical protein F5Y18DRAFT_425314 [Xylariaceae sp. FL1019]|nr:hypothetical protein F5Y18DRAFT_425314 [Xylariaceae sp. FL1019]
MLASHYFLPIALVGISTVVADSLKGDDFNFEVSYITYLDNHGPKFTTSNPPKDAVKASVAALEQPIITLTKPSKDALDDLYISFLEITKVSTMSTRDTVPEAYIFPWVKANQSAGPDGLLTVDLTYFNSSSFQTNEMHEATIQVWKQTPEVLKYITNGGDPKTKLSTLWQNASSDIAGTKLPSLDFERASISFKVHNSTGLCRNDVNSDGEPVSVTKALTSACAAATTAPTASQTSSASQTESPTTTTTTTGTPSPTSTPGAASTNLVGLGWASTASAFVVLFLSLV